jgi:hypothetical protein
MDNFIGQFPNNIPEKTCQGLIKLFNVTHKRKLTNQGVTGSVVDKSRKDSVDLGSAKNRKN